MRTLAIINQKGGCGKTTTAINLAGVLARRGLPTLLIDLDPQSHCAAGLAVPENRIEHHIGDALLTPPDQPLDRSRLVWRISRHFDLVPSLMRLAGIEASRGGLAEAEDRDRRLLDVIRRLSLPDAAPPGVPIAASRYAWCIIDCPPSIGLLTFNALRAADEVIIPVETGFFALKGAAKQANTVRTLAKRLGREASFRVLPTMHDAGSALARALLDEMTRAFGARCIPTPIRADVRLREAVSVGQPVVEYAPDSHGAEDYRALAEWLLSNPPAQSVAATASDIEGPPTQLTEPMAVAGGGALDPVLNRAAELAARLRRLQHAGELYQARLAADPSLQGHLGDHDAGRHGGLAPHSQGCRFVYPAPPDAQVAVAGDFNGWSTTETPLRYNAAIHAHEAEAPLGPGRWRYRLVVNGRWITDPSNPEIEENPFGEWNSVVVVRPASPAPIGTLPEHAQARAG